MNSDWYIGLLVYKFNKLFMFLRIKNELLLDHLRKKNILKTTQLIIV